MIYNNLNFSEPNPSLFKTFNVFEKAISGFEESQQLAIYKAFSIASIGHSGQLRADNANYIIHPIRVALLTLKYMNLFRDSYIIVSAALLHDVVEDSECTIEEIEFFLNKPIATLTEKLTRYRPKNETPEERKFGKYKSWEKIMNSDYNVKLIKSCDYLDNMISWGFIDSSSKFYLKIPRWLNEAKEYYIPLAKTVNKDLYCDMNIIYDNHIKKGHSPSQSSLI